MPAFMDLTGHKYARLTVVGLAGGPPYRWRCLCDCGSVAEVAAAVLRSGGVRSCGCLKREMLREQKTTHGLRDTPEYAVWCSMKGRCHRPKDSAYPKYGARGIRVCERWRASFADFIADMGRRPSPEHSIERKDNNGNYEPGNCHWATRPEQMRNRRGWSRLSKARASVDGVTSADAARRLGTSQATIDDRVRRGWTVERAASQPVRRQRRKSQSKPQTSPENDGRESEEEYEF